jgi:hypothetical protein
MLCLLIVPMETVACSDLEDGEGPTELTNGVLCTKSATLITSRRE